MSRGDKSADNRPHSVATRIFEDMWKGAATARRQRWTIITAAAADGPVSCDEDGCDCRSFVGQYKPPTSRR